MPRYIALRQYFTAIILFSFVVLPVMWSLFFRSLPGQIDTEELKSKDTSELFYGWIRRDQIPFADRYIEKTDSLINLPHEYIEQLSKRMNIDSSERAVFTQVIDTTMRRGMGWINSLIKRDREKMQNCRQHDIIGKASAFFVVALVVSLVALLLYSRRWYRLFRALRRKQKPEADDIDYCRRTFSSNHWVHVALISFPYLLFIAAALSLSAAEFHRLTPSDRDFFLHFTSISGLALLLIAILLFNWQKYRLRIKYIHHIFEAETLRRSIFKGPRGIIRVNIWGTQLITVGLPILLISVFVLIALVQVRALDISIYSRQHARILLGEYYDLFPSGIYPFLIPQIDQLYYIPLPNTLLLLDGMVQAFLVSVAYIAMISRWRSALIITPVNELYHNMINVSEGSYSQFALVRTHNEIGTLAEGFNQMTSKIQQSFAEINDLNAHLEEKVEERTQEVLRQKEEIEAQRDMLSKQNQEITDSIHYAGRIQEAMLPKIRQMETLFPEAFLLYLPQHIIGGDFFWYNTNDSKLIVVVADCTGHGVPGALMSVLGISLLNEVVARYHGNQAAPLLEELRVLLKKALGQKSILATQKDGMDMSLIVYDTVSREINFAGAYNPLWLVRQGELIEYKADRQPVGVYLSEQPFTNYSLQTAPGDVLYLFTDGFPDQFGGEKRKKFTYKRFRELLMSLQTLPLAQQKIELQKQLDLWRGDEPFTDDITVVGIKL